MSRMEINNIILDYLKVYNPLLIGLFGSYARKENTKRSDIDILIRFRDCVSLLQLLRIENELSDKLGIKVDLITEGSIKNDRIKESIKNDLQIIFQA
jgi:predicted nucleotidyltransferase